MLSEPSQSICLSLSNHPFPVKLDSQVGSIGVTVKTAPAKILNNKWLDDLFRVTCDYAMLCVTEYREENVFTKSDPPVSDVLCVVT